MEKFGLAFGPLAVAITGVQTYKFASEILNWSAIFWQISPDETRYQLVYQLVHFAETAAWVGLTVGPAGSAEVVVVHDVVVTVPETAR